MCYVLNIFLWIKHGKCFVSFLSPLLWYPHVTLCRESKDTVPMEVLCNGCKWSAESSPLVNCAKIGLSYFVRAINSPSPHGVCMINVSFLSKTSWCSLGRQRANPSRTPETSWRQVDVLIGGCKQREQPLSFYRRPCPTRKDAHWTLYISAAQFLWTGRSEVYGPVPLRHDESCGGVVVVPRRQTASSKGRNGYGERRVSA